MFTGIVQSVATVFSVNTKNNLAKFVIEVEKQQAQALELGASIAINGVCLTVVQSDQIDDDRYHLQFDVIDETLRVTNLAEIKARDAVNFERSLKVGDEVGGHYLSGHIHVQAALTSIVQTPENTCLEFQLDNEKNGDFSQYLFDKGFIAINGTSLTLGIVEENKFKVHLIPETLSRTNLGDLQLTDNVNIEFDQQTMTIVKTIERMNLQNRMSVS
ncbi:riboflavin synthase subunit alpha [Thalassotalea atypica]|uniref:riboflavin synthase subunit alpha n=1 Tax=Thalassotalea atypica TaxID=2054316 RepID=UPI00257434FB|nr:riboflavin synthase subunit alpha [Thalassotalea atypica]